ncbi:IS200/IS605 family transposase [Stygiobacter electus]|uniref:IS200/IS605 family transposase n=1 Tax=Stygiobacter electus TaxID=3032292 RepID=A0AAE3NZ47_9BACT|nr:IS200/IS605 family transposase [Stygiobacter electus]MDF1611384.1 IS200/IS605 family transposase [Stygiobacter electus]
MSWIRIWIHLVFATKNREPVLIKPIRTKIISHIIENAEKKNILISSLNGFSEHLHCLLLLNREDSISKVSQLIKGESSHWINEQKLLKSKFFWQDDYWAVSVSESHVEAVKKYIDNQEKHHEAKEFNEEIDEFMKKYEWQYIK